ncbi:MAG: altronate dehydratase family protein [Bryobacteraceae bacterium]|jgi:altronate hydrolase
MLLDIRKAPGPDNSLIRLHPADNVAIARVSIAPGAELRVAGAALTARDPIPVGHKIALREIGRGEAVLRYGEAIGRATQTIAAGSYVHTHNVGFEDLRLTFEFPEADTPPVQPQPDAPVFLGYVREDGRVGTRNYIAVVAASNCAAHAVETVARSFESAALPENVDGVVAFPHGDGCGHGAGPDIDQLRRTLGGVLAHPNVSAAVIMGLGCEDNQIEHFFKSAIVNERLTGLTLQSSGGTRGAVEAAREEIYRFVERASQERRTPAPAGKIMLGLNCGGSDSFSGITANPALGRCADLLAAAGGSAVLAETPEIFGAEHLLVRRSRNRKVAETLLSYIEQYKQYLSRFGSAFNDNPSPGNKAGGITNIIEKSLGAVAKGGTSPLMDVVDYAERVTSPGLVFMNTPGYDPVSLAGLAAGGCNLIAFTTGRGSAIGFPTIPVFKIATNSDTFRRMRENMDFDAGAIATGEQSIEDAGRAIFQALLEVASGRRTCAERLGHREFVPWRIGPVV